MSHNYLAQGKSLSWYFFQYKNINKTFPIGLLQPDLSPGQKDINKGLRTVKTSITNDSLNIIDVFIATAKYQNIKAV